MANTDYNFQYTPLTGRLPGNSFVKQTEQAINELAEIVNEGAAQVEVITNLANTANDNSEEALEKANEALETAGRVYITLPNLDDADDYFDSQLYYFANSNSANLPVQDTGFLEVKTNDTKTAAEQVFIANTTGLMYMRHGVITSEEVGDETVYSVTWGTWSSELASEDYVQNELLNYLPLSGGTMTGTITKSGGNTLVVKDANDSLLLICGGTDYVSGAYLSLSGKDRSGSEGIFNIKADDGLNSADLTGSPNGNLTWNAHNVLTDATVGTVVDKSISSSVSVVASTATEITHISLPAGTWIVTGHATFSSPTSGRMYGISLTSSSVGYGYVNDGVIAVHSNSTANLALISTRIFVLSATTNVYLNAYTSVASTVSGATITAVRIV